MDDDNPVVAPTAPETTAVEEDKAQEQNKDKADVQVEENAPEATQQTRPNAVLLRCRSRSGDRSVDEPVTWLLPE